MTKRAVQAAILMSAVLLAGMTLLPAITASAAPVVRTGHITLAGTRLAMTNTNGILHDGNPVTVQAYRATIRQRWAVESRGGYVLIHPAANPGMCLDDDVYSGHVSVWDCGGGPNQKWVPQGDGRLRNIGGSAWDGYPEFLTDPGGRGPGTRLIVTDASRTGQRWVLPRS